MRSWGDIPIFLYGLLIGLNVLQAFILRFLFSIPWDATPFGPIVVVVATFVGLGFALVYLPKELLQQASDAAGVQLGVSTAEQKAPEAADRARERVGDSVSRVREWRSSNDEETSGARRFRRRDEIGPARRNMVVGHVRRG